MKLIKLGASWCSPCLQLAKQLESIELNVQREDVDIDEQPEVAAKYRVRGVPTLVLLDVDGNELGRKVGALNALQIKHWIGQHE